MIVVEGPDGSGKTTLVSRLSEMTGIKVGPKAVPSSGPDEVIDDSLAEWTTHMLNTYTGVMNRGDRAWMIHDRFPLISEPIYGPVCRGTMAKDFETEWFAEALNTFFSHTPLIVLCLPPLEVVKENLANEDIPQMKRAVENIDSIYALYQMWYATWGGSDRIAIFRYDYTLEAHRTEFFQNLVEAIIQERTHRHEDDTLRRLMDTAKRLFGDDIQFGGFIS